METDLQRSRVADLKAAGDLMVDRLIGTAMEVFLFWYSTIYHSNLIDFIQPTGFQQPTS